MFRVVIYDGSDNVITSIDLDNYNDALRLSRDINTTLTYHYAKLIHLN